jgi:uncharacterized protein (DUF885 family)
MVASMSQPYSIEIRGANITATEIIRPGDVLIIGTSTLHDDAEIDDIATMFHEHAPGAHLILVQAASEITTIRAKCDHEREVADDEINP